MTYVLGKTSRSNLIGVHPDLVRCVERAIEITEQDFTVHDGVRTLEEQKEYVRRGVSKTMRSRHLEQSDGLGYAVDLVPYINGKLRWELPACYKIAVAMAKAARELNLNLVWGCVWDKQMKDYDTRSSDTLEEEIHAYKRRHAGSDFLDGPHFELKRK